MKAPPPRTSAPRNTRWVERKDSSSVCPASRKPLNTSMKSAPSRACCTATTRRAIRRRRWMSMLPVSNSASMAMPSWVRVVRGAPRARLVRRGWARPLRAVPTWTKASCCSSWALSSSEKRAEARRRMRVAPAMALEARSGSTTTRTSPGPKKASTSARIQAAKSSAGIFASVAGICRLSSRASVVSRKKRAASRGVIFWRS
ncbi:hypothetical protein D9M68_730350 [compost metagenome]